MKTSKQVANATIVVEHERANGRRRWENKEIFD